MNDSTPTLELERSQELFEQAKRVIPGGVNSPARAFGAVGGHPLFIKKAQGPWIFDVDGNRYIDYVGSWGPMILGHAHPRVQNALAEALERGTSFGAPTEAETRLAERISQMVPSIEKVRLVNSGTEATMSAIRLARGYTGRDKILKFAGCYHGHVDSLLVAAGSAAATCAVPDSPGVTQGTAADTIVLPYNDTSAVHDVFEAQGDEIAAVIVEPVAGNMGCVPPLPNFLQTLRDRTARHGAVLIFDEVITGFRLAAGGAQEFFGIQPDLTTLGKILGGGLPIGAYGGPATIMDCVLPEGPIFQAGTLSGNPLATAAGLATLERLCDNPPYERLEEKGARLAQALDEAARAAGIPHVVQRAGSMLTLFFHDKPIHRWDDAAACDRARFARFFWAMMARGVYLPCSPFEVMFLSDAHTDEVIDRTIDAAHAALAEIA